MTRSIFDPTGDPERSGSPFTPPDADQISQLPDEFTTPPTSPSAGNVDFQPPAEESGIRVSSDQDGKLLTIHMTGRLHKADYAHFVPKVDQAIAKHGKVRMLVIMRNFHGWDAGALWEDTKFDVKHFNHLERVAIVGEKTWEKWMAMFCKPFTTAKIQYFSAAHVAAAREWVAAP
jgi:hypothetical protein